MLWKGSQVPQEEDEETVTKKTIKELEIFVSQIFYTFFLFISFFQLLYVTTFFLYFFYPRHLPTPTTHDPRPTTHDPRHLATLNYNSFILTVAIIGVGIYSIEAGEYKVFDSHARDMYHNSHSEGTCVFVGNTVHA